MPTKAKLTPVPFADPSLESVFNGYQELMESEGAMDFADLLLLSVRRMARGDMPPLPIRWLLVDEAQDMDEVQMEWILLHGRAGAEITLVGDDDQSLYAFRHALGYAGLQEITFALSATETTLPVNYRCAPNILVHAAKLIAHNRTTQDVADLIGADWLIYQDLSDLIEAVGGGKIKIEQFDCAVFDGKYVTGDVDEAYLNKIEQARNDSSKIKTQAVSAIIDLYNN